MNERRLLETYHTIRLKDPDCFVLQWVHQG